MRRLGWLLAVMLISGVSQAYPIDVDVKVQGLDVEALPQLLGGATVIRLVNHEAFPVRCDVQFSNGPEIERIRKVTVQPKADHVARFMPTRAVIRVRVAVACWPAEAARGD